MMDPAQLAETLEELLADASLAEASQVEAHRDDVKISVEADSLRRVLEVLAGAGFGFLAFVTAVDLPEKMMLVYRLGDMDWGVQVCLKCEIDREAPKVESVVDLWPAADWHEREAYDLLGIEFTGHPRLRRLLLPEDWVGHPLRKDYQDDSIERRPDYI